MDKSKRIKNKYLKLIAVNYKDQSHNKLLYKFLKNRVFSISHKNIPKYADHICFVKNNPYRKWFLISHELNIIGSLYILYDNGIGIDVPNSEYKLIDDILDLVFVKIKPLKPIPSIRTNNFHINISSDNDELSTFIIKAGGILKQKTYEFEKI